MFYTVFKKDPMDGKEGRRYRHTVLERGGSQEEMQTLEDFLGRKPNTEAFYKELGIDTITPKDEVKAVTKDDADIAVR